MGDGRAEGSLAMGDGGKVAISLMTKSQKSHTILSPIFYLLEVSWDFRGGPVVKTLCFYCWEQSFNPWSGN